MSVDRPAALAAASDRLRAETSVPGLIGTATRTFVEILDAGACTISRLVEVYGGEGRRFDDEDLQVADRLAGEAGRLLRQPEHPAV